MTHPLDSERLLAQSGWIWHLARSLVADDPTADDVLQDTMVAALERSPRTEEPGTSLRAWLSTVARHLALRRLRTESRRSEREHRAARPIELPPVDRVLERESARRDLVEHVLALDDAYRDTILLRFFDELPPIEIARRLGVPDSTVRNRLRRGLAQLHERLERERGEEWKQWCLLLAPVGSGGAHAPLFSLSGWPAGLLAMGTKLVLLLIALFGALATIFSWHALHGDGDATIVSPAIAARHEQPSAVVDRTSVETASPNDAITQGPRLPAESLAQAADPTGILCFGAVHTSTGSAVTSGTVLIADPIGRARYCSLDARGWYSFAGLAPGHWTLRTECDGFRPFDLTVELTTRSTTDRRDLVLDAATLLNVRIRMRSKDPSSADARTKPGRELTPWTVVATRNAPPSRLGEIASRRHFVYGIGKYRAREPFGGGTIVPDGYDGVLEVHEPLPCSVTLALRHMVVETKVVPVGASEVEFLVDPDAGTRLLAHARVRVVDADSGNPMPGVGVALNPADAYSGGPKTDEDGVALLDDLLPGPLRLSVMEKDHARIERTVEIEPAQMNDLGTVRMVRACRVTGSVVDENGAPVSVRLSLLDAKAVDRPDRFESHGSVQSDSTGRFEFVGVPRGKLLLESQPPDDSWARTCVAVDASAGDVQDAMLRVDRGHAVGLSVESSDVQQVGWIIRRTDGVPVAASDWLGRGPTPLRLADGSYRIEVWRGGSLARTQEFNVTRDGELIRVKL